MASCHHQCYRHWIGWVLNCNALRGIIFIIVIVIFWLKCRIQNIASCHHHHHHWIDWAAARRNALCALTRQIVSSLIILSPSSLFSTSALLPPLTTLPAKSSNKVVQLDFYTILIRLARILWFMNVELIIWGGHFDYLGRTCRWH